MDENETIVENPVQEETQNESTDEHETSPESN